MAMRSWLSSVDPDLEVGFTLPELMISIVIIGLISTAAIMDLNVTRRKDQLDRAVRLVAADLRSLQDRALTGQNMLSCMSTGNSLQMVCQNSQVGCFPGSCTPHSPTAVGFHAVKDATTYELFADVEVSKADWKKTDATEVFQLRDLAQNGAPNVVISDFITTGSNADVDVAFQRQNGAMGINACYAPCSSPVTLRIILRHTQSNEMREVDLNAVTGRISIQ